MLIVLCKSLRYSFFSSKFVKGVYFMTSELLKAQNHYIFHYIIFPTKNVTEKNISKERNITRLLKTSTTKNSELLQKHNGHCWVFKNKKSEYPLEELCRCSVKLTI